MIIIPANTLSAAGGYDVANSLRFNSGSSDYLSRSNGTPTSLRKYTFSAWVKKTATGSLHTLYSNGTNGDNYMYIHFRNDTEQLEYVDVKSGAYQVNLRTNRVFRDPSAFYNVMIAVDTTQGTNTNRVKMYINGVQETSFHTATYPDQNDDLVLNGSNTNIGRYTIETDRHFNGYMSEVVFVDGTQQANTDLGEFDEDSGIWKPIDVSGLTFGDEGYYLDFEDSAALGDDVSGNGNDFTVNNLTAIDQSTDTCTNNFATMNPLHSGAVTFAEGNLQVSRSGSGQSWLNSLSTFAPTSGKWYVELKVNSVGSNGLNMGFANFDLSNLQNVTTGPGEDATSAGLYSNGGPIFYASGTTFATVGSPSGIMQFAMDIDNGFLYWGKDGTWLNSGDPESGATGTGGLALSNLTTGGSYGIALAARNNGDVSFNFGSPPYSESGGETDGNGYGNFAHAVPSGYYVLNSKNLSEFG